MKKNPAKVKTCAEFRKKQGWATMPDEEEPDYVVAEKCVELLMEIS